MLIGVIFASLKKVVVYLNKLHIAISFSGQEAHVSIGVEQRNKNSEKNRPRFVQDGDKSERRNDSADLLFTNVPRLKYSGGPITKHVLILDGQKWFGC